MQSLQRCQLDASGVKLVAQLLPQLEVQMTRKWLCNQVLRASSVLGPIWEPCEAHLLWVWVWCARIWLWLVWGVRPSSAAATSVQCVQELDVGGNRRQS
jgi:hypothetical protein